MTPMNSVRTTSRISRNNEKEHAFECDDDLEWQNEEEHEVECDEDNDNHVEEKDECEEGHKENGKKGEFQLLIVKRDNFFLT
jgi:hypothetical protein